MNPPDSQFLVSACVCTHAIYLFDFILIRTKELISSKKLWDFESYSNIKFAIHWKYIGLKIDLGIKL
jgi:hypothetical protein